MDDVGQASPLAAARGAGAGSVGPHDRYGLLSTALERNTGRRAMVRLVDTRSDAERIWMAGQRFVMNLALGDDLPKPISVVLNWAVGLSR